MKKNKLTTVRINNIIYKQMLSDGFTIQKIIDSWILDFYNNRKIAEFEKMLVKNLEIKSKK